MTRAELVLTVLARTTCTVLTLVPVPAAPGFMPYTKIAPERLRPGHKGDLSYLVGKQVRVRVVQVSGEE